MSAQKLNLKEDLHIHSTFSDGADSIEENIKMAIGRGLTHICCVDHVRKSTNWVPNYVDQIHQLRRKYEGQIKIGIGIEAKFLNASGELDLPENIEGVEYIFAADHQFPYGNDIYHPRQIKELINEGLVKQEVLFRHLIRATIGAMWKYSDDATVVIAHLFSILPKIGLLEQDIHLELKAALARAAIETGSLIEISERWQCPQLESAHFLWEMGVQMPVSTDSHKKETIGEYQFVRTIATQLPLLALTID
ncbi:MAG: PHP domain-containing protein [Rhodothermia bacterium]|nr:PHP domain-containing protein [Rhodothermia bacterium]